MTRRHHKYVLDTQLFIEGFRQPNANEALQAFHRTFAPFEYLSVNERDFTRIRRFVQFEFVRPWPVPVG